MQGLGWCVPRAQKRVVVLPSITGIVAKLQKYLKHNIFFQKNPYSNCFIEKFCHFK